MKVHFFEDPMRVPLPREDIRFNGLGLYMYEDNKRVAVGFDITPFQERPNIQVTVRDEDGLEAASLNVIETMHSNFNLTMHIRDAKATSLYEVEAILYYTALENGDRLIVDRLQRTLNVNIIGEQ
jgi:hypothetical protein